jgi:hypothetical protein
MRVVFITTALSKQLSWVVFPRLWKPFDSAQPLAVAAGPRGRRFRRDRRSPSLGGVALAVHQRRASNCCDGCDAPRAQSRSVLQASVERVEHPLLV